MENTKKCLGCGATLQTTNLDVVGFVQEQHLATQLCQRCFKMKQYSEFQKIEINNSHLWDMISDFVTQQHLIVLTIDITDLLGTSLFELAERLGDTPIIVVVNKIDVIDKKQRRYDIWEQYIEDMYAKYHIQVEKILFVSAKEILGIRYLMNYLQKNAKKRAIKIIGCANVGKSSLLQAFFQEEKYDLKQAPTTFYTPGTTLEELHVPVGDLDLYDTPGIMKPEQITYHLAPKMLKPILLQKKIRPRNYHIYENQTFYLGGYVQVNVFVKEPNSVTFFCNAGLPIHRRKVDENREFFHKHIGELLQPPTKEDIAQTSALQEYKTTTISVKRHKTDIVISGLGWIAIKSAKVKVEVITLKEVLVYQQHALV